MERRIIKVDEVDIEFETTISNVCRDCTYGPAETPNGDYRCKKLKDPENLENNSFSFFDFCQRKVSLKERPISGTLEKNLPHIFQDELNLTKRTEKEAINIYCKNFCVFECQKSECPLYQFKTNE